MFGCLTKLGAKRAELVQKFVRRGRFEVFNDERTRTTPLDPNLMFWCVSYHLGPFGCLTKLGAKRAELVRKFVPRSCVGVFRNGHTLSFCCNSYHFGAFGTVWLPYETRCKTGRTSAKVRATKLHWIFSQRTHPIHPIGSHVLVRFIPFGCIWDRLVAFTKLVAKRAKLVQKFVPRSCVGIFRNECRSTL